MDATVEAADPTWLDPPHYSISSMMGDIFLWDPVTDTNAHIHEHTLTPMNACTRTLPLWAPTKNWVGPENLEIDKVTTGTSLAMGTSPTTKRIVPLNPEINLGKCKHLYQVRDLTQPAELRSICHGMGEMTLPFLTW
jgi:hypothetical protein